MDEDFDEFGNFIGHEYSDSSLESEEEVEEVEHLHQTHATQDISVPLVKRRAEPSPPIQPENWEFHRRLLQTTELQRSVSFIGSAGHGKSSLIKLLVENFSDDEFRGMTLQSRFYAALVRNSAGKSMALNIADSPGHSDFAADVNGCVGVSDGTVLVVDVVEGRDKFPQDVSLLVLNKLDRLILEQRLLPKQAYERIWALLTDLPKVPVVYASAKFQFAFTTDSMANLYYKYSGQKVNVEMMEMHFVEYVLEPIYKLVAATLVRLPTALDALGISLTPSEWDFPADDRISLVFDKYFEEPMGPLVDSIFAHVPHKSDSGKYARNLYINHHEKYTLTRISSVCDGLVPFGDAAVPATALAPGSWILERGHRAKTKPEGYLFISVEPEEDFSGHFEEIGCCLRDASAVLPGTSVLRKPTGEFEVQGTGELVLDTLIRIVKQLTNVKLRVSQPLAELKETVSEESAVAVPTKSPRGDVIEVTAKIKEDESGPECVGCVLVCESDVEKDVLLALVEGFEWCCHQGPLMECPLSGVAFVVNSIDTSGASAALSVAMQRACNAAVLMAAPRILQPVFTISVVGSLAAGKAVYSELEKRGGDVLKDSPVIGTNLYRTNGKVAAMDSFGLEIDILCQLESRNTARLEWGFHGWEQVPGDPLDTFHTAPRLITADEDATARDYMVKTRKRKGLTSDPQLERYIDEDVKELLL